MIERILKALERNQSTEERDHLWNLMYDYSTSVDINETSLDDMANNHLVHGFFGSNSPTNLSDIIKKLSTALGIYGIENHEFSSYPLPRVNMIEYSNSELLTKIQEALGFDITFPSFIGGRVATNTPYGIITVRHCHYLWIVKRILELCPDRNSRIIEIGAGIGLLGWYLDRLGYKDYTVIDLARTSACQTYFLHRNLPHRNLILSGEVENPYADTESIKLLHSSDFVNVPKDRFDLMINIDGLTEMGKDAATDYVSSNCSPMLLSVNHEVNDFRVIDIVKPFKKLVYRFPFWVRDGYVEELYN